jgi:hypothetical protein
LEGFRKVLGRDFRGCLWWGAGIGAASSSSKVDEADLNRSNAFEVIPAPLTPVRGNDFFPPWIPTLAAEAFSVRLRPELLKLNFLVSEP